MTIALVQFKPNNNGGSANSCSVTLDATVGTGNMLVVAIFHDAAISVSSIATTGGTGSDTPTFVGTVPQDPGLVGQYDWYFVPAAGAGRTGISVNFSGSSFAQMACWEWSGLTSPVNDIFFTSTNQTTSSVTGTTGALATTPEAAMLYGGNSFAYATPNAFQSGGWTNDGTDFSFSGSCYGHQVANSSPLSASLDNSGGGGSTGNFSIVTFKSNTVASVELAGARPGTIFVPGGRARGPMRGLSTIRAFADPIVPIAPAVQVGISQGFLFKPGRGPMWDIKRRSAFPPSAAATQVSLPGVAGTGIAGTFTTTVASTSAQAAGIGAAGSLAGADSSTLAPATGTGVAGQLSASVAVTISGAIGVGVGGSINGLDIPGLVGVAGIGVAQGITPQVSAFLSGASGTGQAGAFSFAGAGTGNLTGATGTGVAGGITASIQGFFAGAFGTGVAHAFTAEVDKTLTGVAGVGVAGTLTTTASGTGTLVGVSGTGTAGNINGQDGKGITGAAGTGVAHAGNAEVDHVLSGGVGIGVAGQLSTTATGSQSASIVGVAGVGVAGIITANVPVPPPVVLPGGGNGGALPAPKRRKTIPRPIEAPKPKVEAVLLPPSIARPTPAVARSLPPEPSFTHPLMGALAPPRTAIVKPDDAEDEHAIAMLLEQQIAAERPIREAISQMLIDIMKSIETEIA